jgi:hypothetical protein
MASEIRDCQNCKQGFTIYPEDVDFYRKMDVPPPTFCPECRLIRRLTFRNESTLYKRKCDLCGEEKIMMYPADTPFPVYCKPCWWSDKWSGQDHARDYDPTKPFMAQLGELLRAVPRPGIIHQGNIVNSDYTNRVTDQKNCYLVFGTTLSEDSRYSTQINNSKQCADCYDVQKSERCYECIDCHQCYNLAYSQECNDCTDSYFLYNCRNLQNCFGCVNLRNKSYCIFNEQYSKEEYQNIVAGYISGNSLILDGLRAKFDNFKKQFIVPWMVSHHNQNADGNWIENCKNVGRSFACDNVENGRYLSAVFTAKDAFDYSQWGAGSERVYECVNVGMQCADIRFSTECWSQMLDGQYVLNSHNSKHLFGCIGLRNSEYSILNKAYSKEEYEALAKKIRAEMDSNPYIDKKGRKYGYGEFMPAELSPHAYNETIAQEFFPITQEKAEEMGYPWREEKARDYQITLASNSIPDDIASVTDSILKEVVGCAHAGRCNQKCTTAFRIIPEELQFYRTFKVPLPKLCPNCRHFERIAKRNPMRLWTRKCQCPGSTGQHPGHAAAEHCPNEFETSYSPERMEKVYCETCYQAEVI